MTRADYDRFDLLIGMDRSNLHTMQRICGGDPDGKLHLLLDFTDRQGEEVADPWYTGDFDAVWEDLLEGCQALLRNIGKKKGNPGGFPFCGLLSQIAVFCDGEGQISVTGCVDGNGVLRLSEGCFV